MIPIAKPILGYEEINAVSEVLKSGNLAQDSKVKEFEAEFANYIGTEYAIAVSSGTAALYIALLANGIKKGEEVISNRNCKFNFVCGSKTSFCRY